MSDAPYTLGAALDEAYEWEHHLRAKWRQEILDELRARGCTAALDAVLDAEVEDELAAIFRDRATIARVVAGLGAEGGTAG